MLKLNTITYQVQVEVVDGADSSLVPELAVFLNAVMISHPKTKRVGVKSFPSYAAPYVQPVEDDAHVGSTDNPTEPESV